MESAPDMQETDEQNRDKLALLVRDLEKAEQVIRLAEETGSVLVTPGSLKQLLKIPETEFYNMLMLTFTNSLGKWVGQLTAGDLRGAKLTPLLKKWIAVAKDKGRSLTEADYLAFQGEVQAFSTEQPAFFQPDDTCEGAYFATPINLQGEIERVVDKPALEERVRQLKERGSLLIGNILRAYNVLLATNFASMHPHDFERFVALLFEQMGFSAEVTPRTGDYGIDVVVRKDGQVIAVQCKKYREGHNVGNQEVQLLLGAMQLKGVSASRGILVTTSRFTKQAINQAVSTPVELWDKDVLQTLVRRHLIDA
jgi:hypothetical protein